MADRALLVGINEYAFISDLRGCENDVQNMTHLLTETHGFAPQNIRQHLSQDATKANVLDGFTWLLDGVQRDDRLVLHIAGHGSYVESIDNDEEIDELVCLYDMNIDDPDTYLLDDDLGRFTRQVPDGVRLTVVLDTCHSGTGTRKAGLGRRSPQSPLLITQDTAQRMQDIDDEEAEGKLTRGDTALFRSLEQDPRQIVLARVYERSQRLQQRKLKSRVRHFGASMADGTRSDALNHQLLAAAAPTQTAADAYIDGVYCGAFTHSLCQAARNLGAAATTGQVMTSTIAAVRSGGFSQTPQNEGPFARDPLFGRPRIITPPFPNPGATERPAMLASPSGEELLSQMLRVAEKFIDLADRLIDTEPARAATVLETTRAGNEFVVYVHGISQHPAEIFPALASGYDAPLDAHNRAPRSAVEPRRKPEWFAGGIACPFTGRARIR